MEVIFTSLLRALETAELGGQGAGGGGAEYGSATCSHFIKLGADLLPFERIFHLLGARGVIALLRQLKTICDF